MSAITLFWCFLQAERECVCAWPHHLFLIRTWKVNSCLGRRLMHTHTGTQTHTHCCIIHPISGDAVTVHSVTTGIILYLLQFVSSRTARGSEHERHSDIISEITVGHKESNCFFIRSVIDCDGVLIHSELLPPRVFFFFFDDVCNFVRVHMHQCVHQQERVCFRHHLPWILSMVFNAETADGLCFISRLVSGARSGIPRSPLICCQIFINVTELRSPNDARRFCEGRCYNEPAVLLQLLG